MYVDAGVNPLRAALQADEKYLWVGNDAPQAGDSGITVIDAAALTTAARIPTGRGHHEFVFSADDRYAFVSNRDEGSVSVIDIQKLQKIKDLKTGPLPISLAFSPLSQALYVADGKEGVITVVHADRHEVLARIKAKPGLAAALYTGRPLGVPGQLKRGRGPHRGHINQPVGARHPSGITALSGFPLKGICLRPLPGNGTGEYDQSVRVAEGKRSCPGVPALARMLAEVV